MDEDENLKKREPSLFDIVKVEGRWAQVRVHQMVKYLDTGKVDRVDWEDYENVRIYDSQLYNLEILRNEKLTDEEVKNIYWPGDEEDKETYVYVFAEYKRLVK